MPVPHLIRSLVPQADVKALHIPAGKMFPVFCGCHGHCGDCKEPVVMNRLGRYVHVAELNKARRKGR